MSLSKVIFGESFDTSKVTYMMDMFNDCNNLTELDLSVFDTSNVIAMTGMFQFCEKLTKLDLSNFDTSNVKSYSQMFYGTTNIAEIKVTRDKWTIPNSTITNSGVTDFTYV